MEPLTERFVTGAALSLLAALPAVAQDDTLPELFSDVIDVRVVNVEVVVADKNGNRVRGLQASDFELRVDDNPVPVAYFTEIDEGVVQTASPERSAAEGAGQSVPSLAPNELVRTNYLVFIDEFFAVRRHRDRVLKRLEKDLPQLAQVDHVAVVGFDGQNVARLTDWTNSEAEIRAALGEARKRTALGIMRRGDQDPATPETRRQDQSNPPLPGGGASGLLPSGSVVRASSSALRTRRERDIQRSVLAAVATVRSFADPPGRKVMLILTDGWRVPSLDQDGPFLLRPPPSAQDLYGPLVHAANLVGFTLYPVDLPGLRPDFLADNGRIGDASVGYNAGSGAGGSSDTPPSPFSRPPGWNLEWSQEAALGYLAHETGGLPMINAFRDIALAETAADTRSYYWLGFEPPRNQDDALHDIEVGLAGRPDLRVRSRRSYFDLSKSTEVTMMVEGSVLFGGAPGKEALGVRFGVPQSTRGRKVLVPMEVAIPLDDVAMLPVGGQWMNELEFRVTVINEGGERSETPIEKVRISGTNEPPPGAIFVYATTLLLRSHEHRYVASVFDPLTGAVLSAQGVVGPK